MTSHTASYAQRFKTMGDIAERKFEELAKAGKAPFNRVLGFERAGLNRPDMDEKKLPRRIRNCPDYRTEEGWVECKGMGKDGILKIKVGQFVDLSHYDEAEFPVLIFVWDSSKRRAALLPLTYFNSLIDDGSAELARFHDGRSYFGFRASDLFG